MVAQKTHREPHEMTASELRQYASEELIEMEQRLRDNLLALNENAAGALHGRRRWAQQPHYFSAFRRGIAQIKTILNERKRNGRAVRSQ